MTTGVKLYDVEFCRYMLQLARYGTDLCQYCACPRGPQDFLLKQLQCSDMCLRNPWDRQALMIHVVAMDDNRADRVVKQTPISSTFLSVYAVQQRAPQRGTIPTSCKQFFF